MAALELRSFLHTGDVQGSIPCAPTIWPPEPRFQVIPDAAGGFRHPSHQNVENNPMQSSQWLPVYAFSELDSENFEAFIVFHFSQPRDSAAQDSDLIKNRPVCRPQVMSCQTS